MNMILAAGAGSDYTGVILTGITALAVLFFSMFAKTIYSIFQAGVNYKSNFVTKEEMEKLKKSFEEYKTETKLDFKAWKEESERLILRSVKMLIDSELKNVSKLEAKMDDFNETYLTFKTTADFMYQKLDKITLIEDEIVNMKSRITRLEYDDDENSVRRIAKK